MALIKTIVITFDSMTLLFDMWVRHNGMFQFIVSDRDAKLTMGFWKHLFENVDTKLSFNMTFHSQTDGQTDRVNGVLN
jgi:hypothetical protein